jgi:ADP-ribose pyrophosphatase
MKKSKKSFKGKLLNVVSKRIRLPNGHTSYFDIVEHPGAILVIPFLSQNKIILLRQFRPSINSYLYELPAGTLEKDERLAACCRREIIEETGYSAGKIIRMGKIFPVPGYSTEVITIFKATGLVKAQGPRHEKDEVIQAFPVTRREIRRLFKAGKIFDAKTICAFTMYGWL